MRRSKEDKAATHTRIIAAAVQAFASGGIADIGLSDIMAAAGLTQGGFYRHFSSKEELVAEATDEGLKASKALLMQEKHGPGLKALVERYLSTRHREGKGVVCPLTALGGELRRADARTRQTASRGISDLVAVVASEFPDVDRQHAEARARAVLAAMVGAMTLSRIVSSPSLADAFLDDTRDFILYSQPQGHASSDS